MKRLLALAFTLLSTQALADSFTFFAVIPCPLHADAVVSWPGQDVGGIQVYQPAYVGLVGAGPSRGVPPAFTIVATEVMHEGAGPSHYIVLGKADIAGTGGDYISRRSYGAGSGGIFVFPTDARPVFRPGDVLHIHTNACGPAFATVFFIR